MSKNARAKAQKLTENSTEFQDHMDRKLKVRKEVENMKQRVIALVIQKPEKAAIILTSWLKEPALVKKSHSKK